MPVVPDAPIGHFRLTVFGGKTGYLANTRDLCAPTAAARSFSAQNGGTYSRTVKIKAACGDEGPRQAPPSLIRPRLLLDPRSRAQTG